MIRFVVRSTDLDDGQAQSRRSGCGHRGAVRSDRIHPLVGQALSRPKILLALVRPECCGAFGLGADGQRRIDAQVGRHSGTVDDEHRRVAVNTLVGVDDTVFGIGRDGASTQEVRRQRDVEQLTPRATCDAADLLRDPPSCIVPLGNPGRVRFAVPLLARDLATEDSALGERGDGVVEVLHDERNDGALAPVLDVDHANEVGRVPQECDQELEPARNAASAIGHQRLQQSHRVRALAVANRLDVRVRGRVERGGDGDTLGQIHVRIDFQLRRADDGLGVGPGELAELVGQLRQLALVLHLVEQVLRAPRAGCQHDVRGGKGLRALTNPRARSLGRHIPGAVGQGAQAGYRRHGDDLRAGSFGQGEVVLEQCVLGAVSAAGHALAAFDAACPLGSCAAEVRVVDLLAGLVAEEHTDRGLDEGVSDAHVLGNGLHDLVGGCHVRVANDSEHASRLVVERCGFTAPVGDVGPLLVLEERLRRLVQRVRVVQRATTDARARENQAVAQQVDALNAVATELRRPQEAFEIPAGLGEILVLVPTSGFENADPVTLLDEAQCGDAAAEPGSDDQYVVIRLASL